MVKPMPKQSAPVDLGEFRTLPAKKLNELIEKGRRAAEELDKALRSQFELSETDGTLRLR